MRYLLLCIALLCGVVFGKEIKVVTECNVRETPSVKSGKITNILPGATFKVVDIQCDYYLVDTGTISGYVSTIGIDTNGVVFGQGVTIRSNDTVKSKSLGTIKVGVKVKILGKIVKWYKIASGWVCVDYVKEVK